MCIQRSVFCTSENDQINCLNDNMPNIRSLDMKLVDDLFEMSGGYVLDFSDRTMASFFIDELNVDIDDIRYREFGNSKAKRLRCFLNKVDLATAVQTLTVLWEYREGVRRRDNRPERINNAEGKFLDLLNRLQGKNSSPSQGEEPKPAFIRPKILELKKQLLGFVDMQPQPRGYAFEKWLRDLFEVHGMQPRDSFRLCGEQIDGSFLLQGETYLLEAKWQSAQTGAADLHAFEGKLNQKAAWTRGLFISHSGFTQDGLIAFGRAKRVICMDGLDIFDALNQELPLVQVLERKVRRAAESGNPFVQVRDLFPR